MTKALLIFGKNSQLTSFRKEGQDFKYRVVHKGSLEKIPLGIRTMEDTLELLGDIGHKYVLVPSEFIPFKEET